MNASDPTGESRDSDLSEGQKDPQRLEVLLLDYEMARDDERTLTTAITTAFSVAVALLGLLAAGIIQAKNIPQLMLAGAPLLPLAVFAYMQLLGAQATLRSYYLRGLESELREYASEPMKALGQLQPATYISVAIEMVSMHRGRPGYRILANFVLLIILVVFGGLTLYIGIYLVSSLYLRIAMASVYAPAAFLLLWETAAMSLGGRRLFADTASRYLNEKASLPIAVRTPTATTAVERGPGETQRSLVSYLLLPRPEDWIKGAIEPLTFAIAAWSTGDWQNWTHFTIVWLLLEYFVYMARYQWNDVRGIEGDSAHAEQESRGRLPRGRSSANVRRNVLFSVIVGILRLVSAITIGILFKTTWPILFLIAIVFGIAIVYETLRAAPVGRTRAGTITLSPSIVATWIVVSLGYAVRASVGFSYGGLSLTSMFTIVGVACMASFGAMFVLLTWVLEATSFCRHDVNDVVNDPDESGPWHKLNWYRIKALSRKPHLEVLLTYIDIALAKATKTTKLRETIENRDDRSYCGRHKVLEERGHLLSPWNWTLLLSVTLGAIFGTKLAHPVANNTLTYVITATLSVIGAFALATCSDTRRRLLLLISIAGGMYSAASLTATRIPTLASCPWLVVGAQYVIFRGSSYRDLKKFGLVAQQIPSAILYFFLHRLGFIVKQISVSLLGAIVGPETNALLHRKWRP